MSKLAIHGGRPLRETPFPTYVTLGEEEKRAVMERIGSNYGRRGHPDYLGRFQQMWEHARVMLRAKEKIIQAFAKRAFQAEVETFT